MKYDFITVVDYDYADKKVPHVIEAPKGYKPFAISRWPVAGQGIEFWFVREHIPAKSKHQAFNRSTK